MKPTLTLWVQLRRGEWEAALTSKRDIIWMEGQRQKYFAPLRYKIVRTTEETVQRGNGDGSRARKILSAMNMKRDIMK